MAPKFSTVYQNRKTGKFIRTYHGQNGRRPGYISYSGIAQADATKKVGPILACSHESFEEKYVEVQA